MPRRALTIACVQLQAHDRIDFANRWPHICSLVETAAAAAQLVVLPEGTVPSYVLGHQPYDAKYTACALASLRKIAARYKSVLVIGVARRSSSNVFNSACVIDADGTVSGYADKQYLWHFDRQWFAVGQSTIPLKTAAGTLGALVCADGRIPTIARTLVDRGAELLVIPTAWITSGRDPLNLENILADILVRVRAKENGVPLAAANKCGTEVGCVFYCGKSQIVDNAGTVCAQASQDREEILLGTIELGGPPALRAHLEPPPARRTPKVATPLRIAISTRAPSSATVECLRILETPFLISLEDCARRRVIDRRIPTAWVDDHIFLDPDGLLQYRIAGFQLGVWHTQSDPEWQTILACARAIELRMYVIVLDRIRERAFVVDPDGNVIAGTTPKYHLASFAFDPARVESTVVAPGTDILEALKAAQRVAGVEASHA